MNATTAFAIAALAFAGAACSEPATPQEKPAAEAAVVQPVSAEPESTGSFNLNIGGPSDADEDASGLNFNLGDSSDEGGLFSGESIVDSDFGETPDFGLSEDPELETMTPEPIEDDGLIRIEPK